MWTAVYLEFMISFNRKMTWHYLHFNSWALVIYQIPQALICFIFFAMLVIYKKLVANSFLKQYWSCLHFTNKKVSLCAFQFGLPYLTLCVLWCLMEYAVFLKFCILWLCSRTYCPTISHKLKTNISKISKLWNTHIY